MKKIVSVRCYVSINREEYCDTSIQRRLRYREETGESETIINDWEEAYNQIKNDKVLNATVSETFWKHRPTIIIHYANFDKGDREISEKDFRQLKFKWVVEKVDYVYTAKDLFKELPAEQFCEWLKDQGISTNFNID